MRVTAWPSRARTTRHPAPDREDPENGPADPTDPCGDPRPALQVVLSVLRQLDASRAEARGALPAQWRRSAAAGAYRSPGAAGSSARLASRVRQVWKTFGDEADVRAALGELARSRPGIRRAVISWTKASRRRERRLVRTGRIPVARPPSKRDPRLAYAVPTETRASYFEKLGRMGGSCRGIPGGKRPRVTQRATPHQPWGQVNLVSTRTTRSWVVPWAKRIRAAVSRRPTATARPSSRQACEFGAVLARKGVVSRFAVDFVLPANRGRGPRLGRHGHRDQPAHGWDHASIPGLAILTGGTLDAGTGVFRAPSGLFQVLPLHRQPLLACLSRRLAGRFIEIMTANLPASTTPSRRDGRPLPSDGSALRVRQGRTRQRLPTALGGRGLLTPAPSRRSDAETACNLAAPA